MSPLFTIIFGYRDRDLLRVERCLESLKQQSQQNFHVIFVDYGSKTQQAGDLVKRYSFCDYIYSDTRGYPWNRAKALNIGIREAKTEYTITSDVDMVFPSDFFVKLAPYAQKQVIVNARWFWLPKDFAGWDQLDHFTTLPMSNDAAKGGFQLVATEHLQQIQGFDEYYQYYGVEDRDINHRLRKMGLEQIWFDTPMYHQWHETATYNTTGFMPEGVWERMNVYYLQHLEVIVRNAVEWGGVTNRTERQVFQFVDPSTDKLIESHRLYHWNKQPWSHDHNAEFLGFITQMPHGDAVLVSEYYAPKPSMMADRIVRYFNKVMRRVDRQGVVDFQVNHLRQMLALMIENHDFFIDYYLCPQGRFAIFVKK